MDIVLLEKIVLQYLNMSSILSPNINHSVPHQVLERRPPALVEFCIVWKVLNAEIDHFIPHKFESTICVIGQTK